MTRDELLARLDGTEWTDFEIKSAAGGVPQDAFKTIAAMANSGGGWIVFGASEQDGEYTITGIGDIDRFQNDLLSAIRTGDKVSRPPAVQPRLFQFDEGWVLALQVEESTRTDKPVRCRVKGRWLAYVRIGAGDHRCRPEEEGRFVRDATFERFDQGACPEVGLDELDDDAIQWIRRLMELRSPDAVETDWDLTTWLRFLRLARSDGTLTHAATLLFGQPQVIAARKPGGVVDLRVMHTPAAAGIPSHRWDDRILCENNLCDAIRVLFERFHTLCPQPFEFEEGGIFRRASSREEDALREALINVIAHQEYTDPSRTATILWWRDRITFNNPGDSFITPEQMRSGGYTDLRNPLIARVLRQAGLAEQAGMGLPMILKTWGDVGRPEPEIHNDAGNKRFEIAFPWGPRSAAREGANDGVNDGVNEPVSGKEGQAGGVSGGVDGPVNEPVTARDDPVFDPVNGPVNLDPDMPLSERVLQLLQTNPGLRVPALMARLGVSDSTVKRALRGLKATGRVTFRGAPKTGGYHLTPDDEEDPQR